MLNIYDNLAEFEGEKPAESESAAEMAQDNASVDVSAIVARLIEVERKLDNLTKSQQNKPAVCGQNDSEDESAPAEKENENNAG